MFSRGIVYEFFWVSFLTDLISNSKLYEKCSFIPLSKPITRECSVDEESFFSAIHLSPNESRLSLKGAEEVIRKALMEI